MRFSLLCVDLRQRRLPELQAWSGAPAPGPFAALSETKFIGILYSFTTQGRKRATAFQTSSHSGRRCDGRKLQVLLASVLWVSASGCKPGDTPGPGGLCAPTRIAGGASHVLALCRDGTVWAWGANDRGQLGDGTTTEQATPVQVPGLTSVTALAAGGKHSLALRGDGTVWAWGDNMFGQLGIGTARVMPSPRSPLLP